MDCFGENRDAKNLSDRGPSREGNRQWDLLLEALGLPLEAL